jgi:hypothetical protein
MQYRIPLLILAAVLILTAVGCVSSGLVEETVVPGLEVRVQRIQIEVGQETRISAMAYGEGQQIPEYIWQAARGEIVAGPVAGEVQFIAPDKPGRIDIAVQARVGGNTYSSDLVIEVLEQGALNKLSRVLVQVDTNTLTGVYVDESHPSENFAGPLTIKGTFRYDPETGEAYAGGSWPSFLMYDDGTHGDPVAGDGIWSILFNFEKSDEKVYFAFDDANEYRKQYESGLMWRVKNEWIKLDEFPNDNDNPAFAPDGDKVIIWDAALAEAAGIYGAP